ncbi:MAG: hypothetical protein O2884_07135, partial [Chloroflexi bacterium]|nr:hypothetical protein [Chloroflexota bacterium]
GDAVASVLPGPAVSYTTSWDSTQNNDLQSWFWAETAAGNMLSKIAARLNASDDETVKRAAFGIAR